MKHKPEADFQTKYKCSDTPPRPAQAPPHGQSSEAFLFPKEMRKPLHIPNVKPQILIFLNAQKSKNKDNFSSSLKDF